MKLKSIHHIAIICSNYEVSKAFYTETLGLEIIRETYREQRNSWKLDLALNGHYILELFSFPNVPERPSYPEACGLRHLAFACENIDQHILDLSLKGVKCEPVRVDEFTGKQFTFFSVFECKVIFR
ncbi:MAG: VOC family protein [Flavobacteriales bacterium]|nr:VOC family protein [Flavobacteriales bacterium]